MRILEFASDIKMKALSKESKEVFYKEVLLDETPLFVSDEATVLDVSGDTAEELSERCLQYYGKALSAEDLRLPLWQLILKLNETK